MSIFKLEFCHTGIKTNRVAMFGRLKNDSYNKSIKVKQFPPLKKVRRTQEALPIDESSETNTQLR